MNYNWGNFAMQISWKYADNVDIWMNIGMEVIIVTL